MENGNQIEHRTADTTLQPEEVKVAVRAIIGRLKDELYHAKRHGVADFRETVVLIDQTDNELRTVIENVTVATAALPDTADKTQVAAMVDAIRYATEEAAREATDGDDLYVSVESRYSDTFGTLRPFMLTLFTRPCDEWIRLRDTIKKRSLTTLHPDEVYRVPCIESDGETLWAGYRQFLAYCPEECRDILQQLDADKKIIAFYIGRSCLPAANDTFNSCTEQTYLDFVCASRRAR